MAIFWFSSWAKKFELKEKSHEPSRAENTSARYDTPCMKNTVKTFSDIPLHHKPTVGVFYLPVLFNIHISIVKIYYLTNKFDQMCSVHSLGLRENGKWCLAYNTSTQLLR